MKKYRSIQRFGFMVDIAIVESRSGEDKDTLLLNPWTNAKRIPVIIIIIAFLTPFHSMSLLKSSPLNINSSYRGKKKSALGLTSLPSLYQETSCK